MASLETKIKEYLKANSKTWEAEQDNMNLQDDRIAGVVAPYIKAWNVSGLAEPTDEQLNNLESVADEKEAEIQAEYDALEWKRNRQSEYPDAIECVHALLDGGDTLTDLQTKRTTIKEKYPKE